MKVYALLVDFVYKVISGVFLSKFCSFVLGVKDWFVHIHWQYYIHALFSYFIGSHRRESATVFDIVSYINMSRSDSGREAGEGPCYPVREPDFCLFVRVSTGRVGPRPA